MPATPAAAVMFRDPAAAAPPLGSAIGIAHNSWPGLLSKNLAHIAASIEPTPNCCRAVAFEPIGIGTLSAATPAANFWPVKSAGWLCTDPPACEPSTVNQNSGNSQFSGMPVLMPAMEESSA